MSRSILLLVAVALSTVGCVAVRHAPLTDNDSTQLATKTVQRSVYQKPSFIAFTAGKAMFGALGAAAMISAGNEIIQANSVEDPALHIGQEIAQALSSQYAVHAVTSEPSVAASDEVDALAKTYNEADLILDVKTLGWQFLYFPTSFAHYRVVYSARLRLIDRQRRTVVAEEVCSYEPKYADTSTAPTHDDLVGNNAAGLKQELSKAATHCIEFFRHSALRL